MRFLNLNKESISKRGRRDEARSGRGLRGVEVNGPVPYIAEEIFVKGFRGLNNVIPTVGKIQI